MSETITISLKEREGMEDYARTDRNILQARVRVGADGEWHSSPGCIVDLTLSREAMIGLATALLRAAHQHPDNVNFVEMLPSEVGCAVERFGVFIHPQSCRLHLRQQDFGGLETLLH